MSVDVSGLLTAIDDYALGRWECVTQSFVMQARDNAPFKTGALAGSVEASGPDVGGGIAHSEVTVGEEYGVYQNEGTGPIVGNPLLAFEVDGELVIVHSTSGVPATHWWDNTVNDWGAILGYCE